MGTSRAVGGMDEARSDGADGLDVERTTPVGCGDEDESADLRQGFVKHLPLQLLQGSGRAGQLLHGAIGDEVQQRGSQRRAAATRAAVLGRMVGHTLSL